MATTPEPTSSDTVESHTDTPPPSRAWRGRLFFFSLVLVCSVSVFTSYQLWQALIELQRHTRSSLQPLTEQLSTLTQQLQQQHLAQQQQASDLQQLQQQNRDLQLRLHQVASQPRNDSDWTLAEVRYLGAIAEQQWLLLHDAESTQITLTLMAQRLQRLQEPTVLPLLDTVNTVLTQLKALPKAQWTTWSQQLSEAVLNIPDWPLALTRQQPAEVETPAAANVLQQAWFAVSDLVQVRYVDEPDLGLLTPEQQQQIATMLRLKLESVRGLLIQRQVTALPVAIQSVQQWLSRYYSRHTPAVHNLQQQLNQLASFPFQAELPALTALSVQLNALTAPAE